jgi:hypothetical protein
MLFSFRSAVDNAYVFDESLLLVLAVMHGIYCNFASRFKFLCVYSALAVAQGDSLP